jgi:hypothetical protein
MNLQPINPPLKDGQRLICVKCNEWKAIFADLDGEPFKAYYCADCAQQTKERHQ